MAAITGAPCSNSSAIGSSPAPRPPLRQDRVRHPIGRVIQRGIGKSDACRLDGNPVRIPARLLLEAVRDRLLDLLLPEWDERVRRTHPAVRQSRLRPRTWIGSK